MRARAGRLRSVPYPQDLSNIPMIEGRQMDAKDFTQMIIDQFDGMLEQSLRHQPLVIGIALHPYLVGQPYRLRQLRLALQHIVEHRAPTGPDDVSITTPGAVMEATEAEATEACLAPQRS